MCNVLPVFTDTECKLGYLTNQEAQAHAIEWRTGSAFIEQMNRDVTKKHRQDARKEMQKIIDATPSQQRIAEQLAQMDMEEQQAQRMAADYDAAANSHQPAANTANNAAENNAATNNNDDIAAQLASSTSDDAKATISSFIKKVRRDEDRETQTDITLESRISLLRSIIYFMGASDGCKVSKAMDRFFLHPVMFDLIKKRQQKIVDPDGYPYKK